MTHRPFRFGISFGGNPTRSELVDSVKRAEDAGFSVVSSADHLSSRLAVLPLLSTVAEVSSMRVSPMVIANDYRHPVVLARDAATMDILSDGRFELGIGTGWIKEQYEASGIPYDDAGTRVDRFEEAIQVIKGCWSGEPFTFKGEHYQVDGITCPQPLQQPNPPLLIAGSGRRMLSIAAREADIIGISPLRRGSTGFGDFGVGLATSAERMDAQLGWIKENVGARFDQIELSVVAHHLEVGDDVAGMAEKLARSWHTTAEEVLASPHVFLGPIERMVEVIEQRRELYEISYLVFLGADFELVEPVVRRLAGT